MLRNNQKMQLLVAGAGSKVDSLLGRFNNERRTCGPAGVKYT